MKIKRFVIFAFLIFTYSYSFSQSPVEVTGQIKDADTKKSLEFCTIAVFNQNDSLISGAVSDENGFFSVNLSRGIYRFNFSFIGYQTDTLKDIRVAENIFLGNIKLKPVLNELKEVSVTTSSNENTIDREVQIVTDKMKAGTSTTKEVLDKMKGVDYDRYTNSIKVDNSSKIIILVDGMEKDQEYVKNIAPDRLKKIEIIRDPSGRYALEGYTAVINIILKKDYVGTELFLQNNNLFDLDASKSEYIFVQNYSSATLNYTYNKLNVYARINTNYNSFNLNSTGLKDFFIDSTTIEQNPIENDMNTKVKQMYNNFTFGTDYSINPKHSISFEGNLSLQPKSNNATTENYNVLEKKNEVIYNYYRLFNQSKSDVVSSYYSLFYDGKLDLKNSFRSNLTFSNYNEEYDNMNFINDVFFRREIGNNLKNTFKFYVEYDHVINDKQSIQFGYGNSYEKMNNSFEIESVKSDFTSSDFRNKLYAYYSLQINKKWGLKLGCAGETSNPKNDYNNLNYYIYLPYGDFKYKPSESIDFKLKYRSNSEYPSIAQTNPFQMRIDNRSVRVGNPALKPQVTHKLSMETNILQGFARIEPYFHFSNTYIADIGNLINDTIMQYTYANVAKYSNYGILVNFTIPFGKTLFLQNDFNFFKTGIEFNDKLNEDNDFTMSSQLVYVNQKNGLVAGAKYQKENRKYITAQGFNRWNNDFWLAFVQKPFLKQRMSVMIAYISPITYGVNLDQGSYFKANNYIETRSNDISILKNIVVFEISYRFNKGKTINKKEKTIDVKNEKTIKGIL